MTITNLLHALLRRYLFTGMLLSTVVAVLVFRHAGIDAELWQAYTYLGAAALLFGAEQIIPRDRSWNYVSEGRPFQLRNAATDFVFLLGVDPLSMSMRLLLSMWVVGHVGKFVAFPHVSSLPPVVQIALLTLIADGFRYLVHRLQHQISWLWRFHALHHIPGQLVAIRASRTHPFDDLISYVPETVAFLLLGFDSAVVSGFYCIVWVIALISHANVNIAPDRWMSRLFQHPRYHLGHHALQSGTEPTFNFSEITTLWDRVFGTFRDAPLGEDFKVGVASRQPRTLSHEFLGSFYLPAERL